MTFAFDPRLGRRDLLRGAASLSALAVAGRGAARPGPSPDPVLADIHRRTFDYFWETSDAQTGLTPDGWPNPTTCSIAAVGFALTAYCIGAANRYVSRFEAARRVERTLRTFRDGPQGASAHGVMGHKGFFYHFLDMNTGLRAAHCELSSIDTTLLMLGVLTTAGYFDGDSPTEAAIRRLAIDLYAGVDWRFMTRPNGVVSMGWRPEHGLIAHDWIHYNEGQMLYLLGLGSPSHPLPGKSYAAWTASLAGGWNNRLAPPHLTFPPMFGHQYTQCWYDLRGIADKYMRGRRIDWFENSRRATLYQRAYAIADPLGFKGYGADVWGLTACEGPGPATAVVDGRLVRFRGYAARGPQIGDHESIDDGTIAPTAGIGSMPFAPEICVPLAHALIARYGSAIYGRYGFHDAFNPSFPSPSQSQTGRPSPAGWVAGGFLGIDQGPILIGIENYRSGSVWSWFDRGAISGAIARRGLLAAGFEPVDARGRWLVRGASS